jgi:hypothetical protein
VNFVRSLLARFALAWGARRPCPDPSDPRQRTDSDWVRYRMPVRHRDLELGKRALRWLGALPEDQRPLVLAERYPRIVNRLAALWHDHGLAEYALDDLLHDTRGGRQGFAPEIVRELEALALVHEARCIRAGDPAVERWKLSTQF